MGFLAASPFLVKGLCTPMSGLTADILRKSRVSTTVVRKAFYAVGNFFKSYFLFLRFDSTKCPAVFYFCRQEESTCLVLEFNLEPGFNLVA